MKRILHRYFFNFINSRLLDECLASKLARLLRHTPLTPNIITTLNLVLVIIAALLFSTGRDIYSDIAALLFMLTRFFDHLDGEVARLKQLESRVGYYYDWFTDTFSYSILFVSLFFGFRDRLDTLGMTIVFVSLIACFLNTVIGLLVEQQDEPALRSGFPSYAGFSIDDGIYLIGPVTWAGYLFPFYILCMLGSIIYISFVIIRFVLIYLTNSNYNNYG
jgi:phosphatidylglycerophosphate synthase